MSGKTSLQSDRLDGVEPMETDASPAEMPDREQHARVLMILAVAPKLASQCVTTTDAVLPSVKFTGVLYLHLS